MSETVSDLVCAVVALFSHSIELIPAGQKRAKRCVFFAVSIILSVLPWGLSAASGCVAMPPLWTGQGSCHSHRLIYSGSERSPGDVSTQTPLFFQI